MGPASLPAPRSPSLYPDDLGEPPLPGVVQNDVTAMMFSTISRTLHVSARHRDARRIGPDQPRPKPLRSYRFSLVRWLVRAGVHHPHIVPASVLRKGRGPVPSDGLVPVRKPSPSRLAVPWPEPSHPVRHFAAPAEAQLAPHLSQAVRNRPVGGMPLAASAVRQDRSEDLTRRVFRHCCGQSRRTETRRSFLLLFRVLPLEAQGRSRRSDA